MTALGTSTIPLEARILSLLHTRARCQTQTVTKLLERVNKELTIAFNCSLSNILWPHRHRRAPDAAPRHHPSSMIVLQDYFSDRELELRTRFVEGEVKGC